MKNMTKCLISIVICTCLCIASSYTATAQQEENDISLRIEQRYSQIMEQALEDLTHFEHTSNFNYQDLIINALGGCLSDILVINNQLIHEHFSDKSQQIEKEKFDVCCKCERYWYEIPFFIGSLPEEFSVSSKNLIVPDCLLTVPESNFVFYITFFKTHMNMAKDLIRTDPSVIGLGISSLLAQELIYRTKIAFCPCFDLESATVHLLSLFEQDIITTAFPGDKNTFNYQKYHQLLASALQKMNGGTFESQLELASNLLTWNKEKYNYKRLLSILPSNKESIYQLIDKVNEEIHNLAIRFLLMNALYDRLINLDGTVPMKTEYINPVKWLYKLVQTKEFAPDQNTLPTGHPQKSILDNINKRRGEIFDQFKEELTSRNHPLPAARISFDPVIIKWLVIYLHNYSPQIAKERTRLKKLIEESETINSNELIKLTKEIVKKDPYLKKIFSLIKEPVMVMDDRKSLKGKDSPDEIVMEWIWSLTRDNKPLDKEIVTAKITETFGSGGGRSNITGIQQSAKVWVLKSPESGPEEIPLGEVKPGYCVRSLDQWRLIDESRLVWLRVQDVEIKSTNFLYNLKSGNSAVRIAPLQKILTEEVGALWLWSKPSGIFPNKNNLLMTVKGETGPDSDRVEPIPLSHIEKIKGKDTVIVLTLLTPFEGAYFAESRLVKTPSEPPLSGVEAKAMVETPNGKSKLNDLKESDKISAFELWTPKPYISNPESKKTKTVFQSIRISYTLPDGRVNNLRMVRDQELFIYTRSGEINTIPAYTLQKGQLLVTGFDEKGIPLTAVITQIEKPEGPLTVCSLIINEPGIIRLNGILVPVTYQMKISDGFKWDTKVQSAPVETDKFYHADAETGIDLSDTQAITLSEVESKNGPRLLSYKSKGEYKYFYYGQARFTKSEGPTRYLKISTEKSCLELGHLQQLYIIRNLGGIEIIERKEARKLEIGDQVFQLMKKKQDIWTVEPVAINAIEEIYPQEGKEEMILVDFIDGEKKGMYRYDELSRQFGNIFANGILVFLEPKGSRIIRAYTEKDIGLCGICSTFGRKKSGPPGGRGGFGGGLRGGGGGFGYGSNGEGFGKSGSSPSSISTPLKISETDKYRRTYEGGIYDENCSIPKVNFTSTDYSYFSQNLTELKKIIDNEEKLLDHGPLKIANNDNLLKFLKKYYNFVSGNNKPVSDIQIVNLFNTIYKKLNHDFDSYLDIRELLITTGDTGAIPAMINEYVYISYLLYGANKKDAGDCFTKDILTIVSRIINKQEGKKYYLDDRLNIRDSIIFIRDLLLYISNQNQEGGRSEAMGVTFSSEGWSDIIQDFIQNKGFKDIAESDIHQVNLYNFYRQLDRWVEKRDLAKSLLAPFFNPDNFLKNEDFSTAFGLGKQYIKVDQE